MKFDIRFLTCDRTKKSDKGVNYIHTTIANFLCAGGISDGSVSLYVSHPDTLYLSNYYKQFKIISADRELNGYENYIRVCKEPTSSDIIVILEDDLDFSTEFLYKVNNWIEKNNHFLNGNIITLYTPYNEINQCFYNGLDFWNYPIEGFYGTQALLGMPEVIKECGEFISKVKEMPYDMAIKEWLWATKKGIISTVPCFVQHIGIVSSIHYGDTHYSSGFRK